MEPDDVIVEVEPLNSTDSRVKARASALVELGDPGAFQILGLMVVQGREGTLRVVYPTRRGKQDGQYFEVVRLFGEIHRVVNREILRAYTEAVQASRK